LPPKHLFDEWSKLALELGKCGTACILLDFDGTISPFAKKPHLALIPARAKRALVALSSDSRIKVGVISGRSLADVKQMVGVPGIFYAGNHGLEVEGPGLKFIHPLAEKQQSEVKACASALIRLLEGFRGTIVEDKGLTASVHYRLLSEKSIAPMLKVVEMEVKRHKGLTLRHGKRVVEIKPDIAWGKGKAVELIIARINNGCLPVYVGDDETDEDAFASPMIHWSVRVMEKGVPTKARYCLRSIAEVLSFLGRLIKRSTDDLPRIGNHFPL
jgi:trehalose 6-phosphate phosphatase